MKKTFRLLMLALLSTFALASCEDVPMPYPNPDVDGGSDEITEEILPEGDGTFENPYNVAAVVELCNNLGSDAESAQAVYVKGKVASNTTTEATISQYGNMTFTMIDEGNTKTTFTAFQVYGPEKKKFTSVDQIKEGDEVIVCGKVVNYKGNTPETVGKGQSYVVSINGQGEQPAEPGTDTPAEAKGSGTQADPYNVAGVLAYINTLGADKESANEVYIKGKVSSNNTTDATISQYGNMTFDMVDEGSNATFMAFQVYGPGKKKFTAVSQIKEGDEVVVCGKVVNYKGNTPETVGKGQAYVVSINGKGEEGGTDQPGTDQPTTGDEITVAEAMALIAALADAGQTDAQYTVSGKIESITEISTQYGNATFILEGGLTIFRCKDIGNVNFTDEKRLKVGDEVKVQGYLKKYVKDGTTTPELTGGKLISINGSTEGPSAGNDDNSGENTSGNTTTNDGSKVITFNVGEDKGSCTSSAAGPDQMSKNGITIAITKGALANTDNYRTYKSETMTIKSSASNIVSVEITCTADDDAQYGPGNFTAEAGQYSYKGKVGTWTGDAATVSLKATSAQVRATKIVVTIK